ncbi:MAG: hypothetical protein IJO64_03165 [Clostridia bacterium]|nr:hypothetical protein [Clostridia bacterium]MBQ9848041.1 hypothetical protein [Clostridia bacterium]
MKKLRPILGISLIVQSITFFVLFLINLEKKKNLAKTFAAFSALGGVAGTALLVAEFRERRKLKAAEEEDYYDEFLDDFDDLDISEDDILCSFEGASEE